MLDLTPPVVGDACQRRQLTALARSQRPALAPEHEGAVDRRQRGPGHVVGAPSPLGPCAPVVLDRRRVDRVAAAGHERAQPGRRREARRSTPTARRRRGPRARTTAPRSRAPRGPRGSRTPRRPTSRSPAPRPSRARRAGGRGRARCEGRTSSTSTPSTWPISATSSETRSGVGQVDDQLVDGPARAPLEDVDADDVAAHRADAAGHRAQGAGAVGQPQPYDEGLHGASSVPAACEREISCPTTRA